MTSRINAWNNLLAATITMMVVCAFCGKTQLGIHVSKHKFTQVPATAKHTPYGLMNPFVNEFDSPR